LGCEKDYGPGVFDRGDFECLAEQLAGIKGRFLLSLNDTPGVREVFGRFTIEAVETTYTVSAGASAQKAGEVLVKN
jgi:DNA adenine methylase